MSRYMNSWSKTCLVVALSLVSTAGLSADKAHWGKAKHKCTSGTNGLVSAKLKGVKLGKKMKTCEGKDGNTPPPFNARGASGAPDYCKKWPAGVYGYWNIENDKQCKDGKKEKGNQDPYWDKPKHRCTAPGKGRVEARLLGVDGAWWGKKGRKFDLCNSEDAPAIDAFGMTGKPTSCKKRAVHVYGIWDNNDDAICAPVWGEVEKKGCMGPIDSASSNPAESMYRQVSRAKISKLKNGGKWWQINKWKWPLTNKKRQWAREQCLNMEHPTKGKPDYCKVKSGVWAYWYQTVQQCETPLEWAKFKDNGCVKDMQQPDLPGSDIDITGMRSYSARLKKVAGNWLESCITWPIENQEARNGTVLNAPKPSGCLIQNGNKAVGVVVGTTLAVGAVAASGGTSTGASGVFYTAGATVGQSLAEAVATEGVLLAMDTTTSIDGVVWVEDASCR